MNPFEDIQQVVNDLEKPEIDYSLEPIENPNSDCFGCEAGMCDYRYCRGDQYFWQQDSHQFD